MAAIACVTNLATPPRDHSPIGMQLAPPSRLNRPWRDPSQTRLMRMSHLRVSASGPDAISEKVAESIKEAEEACAGDPVSGECVAAWDAVEELSAAASHARERSKNSDPLETYCKDNPETDECRTYDN
uniref:CP12 domain-containing protein n=1 Tax=Kalanchoe fedtschenkoi TaxID=63787 RepID=A0A7N0TMV0_KALFE